MLIYRKGTPFLHMFRLTGSAIPQAIPFGLYTAIFTLLIELFVPASVLSNLMQHPYPFQPFAYISAFALVFRTQVAYNRFWECATALTLMSGKWGDAFTEAITFDELINTNKREYGEAGAKWLEVRRRYQMLMARRYSLCHALALQYVRRDDSLSNLVEAPEAGRKPSVPMGPGAFGGMNQPSSRADPKWQQLEVLGGLTESEIQTLENSADRVGFIFAQIMHISAQRRCDGGLGSDPPVLSRYWQVLSDGSIGMRQARKIEDIPFPWPYTQAVTAMTYMFIVVFPLVLAHFANCGSDKTCTAPNYWVGPFLGFITSTSYVTLDIVSRALEDPCVHPPNDLPGNAMQCAFNNRLLTTLDAVRRPADAVVNKSDEEEDVDKYWGECAELEAADVRRATNRFLKQWRSHESLSDLNVREIRAPSYRGKGMVATPGVVKLSSGGK
jgi:predicted membrane chloride channel (bestrophin family)